MAFFKPKNVVGYGTVELATHEEVKTISAPERTQETILAIANLAGGYLNSHPSLTTRLTRREIMKGKVPNLLARSGLDIPLTQRKATLASYIETTALRLREHIIALHANGSLPRLLEEWASLLYLIESTGYRLNFTSDTDTVIREIATSCVSIDEAETLTTNGVGEFGKIFGHEVAEGGRVVRSDASSAFPMTISAHLANLERKWNLHPGNKEQLKTPLLTEKFRREPEHLAASLEDMVDAFNDSVTQQASMGKAKAGCFRFCCRR